MSSKRKIVALACATAAVVPVAVVGTSAIATHEPANKAAATANGVAEFDRSAVLLQERIKVSSPYDLILQLTSEVLDLDAADDGRHGHHGHRDGQRLGPDVHHPRRAQGPDLHGRH